MTLVRSRFVPSYHPRGRSPGFGTFEDFMVSDQIRKPTIRAAYDIVAVAKVLAPRGPEKDGQHYADRFTVHEGPMEVPIFDSRVGRLNRHAMVMISNDADNAVAVEFGSGPTAEGPSAGQERAQGGYNKAYRPLGRAGRVIGRATEEK